MTIFYDECEYPVILGGSDNFVQFCLGINFINNGIKETTTLHLVMS